MPDHVIEPLADHTKNCDWCDRWGYIFAVVRADQYNLCQECAEEWAEDPDGCFTIVDEHTAQVGEVVYDDCFTETYTVSFGPDDGYGFEYTSHTRRIAIDCGNRWTVSAIWGSHAYCANNDRPHGQFFESPPNAEIAAFTKDTDTGEGQWWNFSLSCPSDDSDVMGYVRPRAFNEFVERIRRL